MEKVLLKEFSEDLQNLLSFVFSDVEVEDISDEASDCVRISMKIRVFELCSDENGYHLLKYTKVAGKDVLKLVSSYSYLDEAIEELIKEEFQLRIDAITHPLKIMTGHI